MTSSEKLRDTDYYFDIFERSYAVPYSCKVSYPGVNLFRIYDKRTFCHPPRPPAGLFNVKKTQPGRGYIIATLVEQ